MINKDEEFTRKVVGVMGAAAPNDIKIAVNGNQLEITINKTRRQVMGTAEFYKMNAREILITLGVKPNDRRI